MSVYVGVEGVVSALKVLMTAALPGVLDEIALRRNDGLVVEYPKAVMYGRPGAAEWSDWPFVLVLPGPSKNRNGSTWTELASHDVVVICLVEDADPIRLDAKLLRYQQAVIEVLRRNRAGNTCLDEWGSSGWTGISWTDTMPGKRFQTTGTVPVFRDSTMIMAQALREE